jgi:hypothetical protein
MHQLTQEAKSLWRIKDDYIQDSGNDESLKAFWEEMKKDKEAHIEKLKELIKKYMA